MALGADPRAHCAPPTDILGIVFAPRLLLREPLVLLAPLDPAAPYPHGIAASLRQGLRFLADAQGTDFAPQPPYFVPHRPRSPPHPGRPLSARQHVARALLNSVGAGAIALVLQACFPSVTADFTLRRPLDAPMPLIPRRWQPLPRFATQYVWSATVGLFLLLFLVRAGAHTLACLGIALGGLPPDGYVEPADRPWAADGLHTFWSARWHGYLVPTMRFYSAVVVPRAVVPAPAARAVLGPFVAFAVAAVLHDVFLLPAVAFPARPHLSAISLYFVLQPVGMLAERAFARLTGRRVRGPLGRLWLAAWFTATSPFFVDSAFHVWAAPGLPMR